MIPLWKHWKRLEAADLSGRRRPGSSESGRAAGPARSRRASPREAS